MVQYSQQTGVCPSQLGIRSGLDNTLFPDGSRRFSRPGAGNKKEECKEGFNLFFSPTVF